MRICVVCFDFKKLNVKLQPWRYIYELSRGMINNGWVIEIITDGFPELPKEENIGNIKIHRLKRITTLLQNIELIQFIHVINPDIVLFSIGSTSIFLHNTINKIEYPLLGLWMGTEYSLSELFNLGVYELIRNLKSLYLFIVSALIPSFIIRRYLLSNMKNIIVLNRNMAKILHERFKVDFNIIKIISTGITDYELERPSLNEIEAFKKDHSIVEEDFSLLYFGSPITLRGTDTLIDAIEIIRLKIPSVKLILLSRRRNELLKEELRLKNLIKKKNLEKQIIIISGFLEREDIKRFIICSNIVVLPFKIVQSDTPIAILEAMALGKTVIATKIDGIPELLENERGVLIKASDHEELANALINLFKNQDKIRIIEKNARKYMLHYYKWDYSIMIIMETIKTIMEN